MKIPLGPLGDLTVSVPKGLGTGLAVNEWSVAAINVESATPDVVARASHGWDTGGWVVDTRRNAFQ